MRFKLQSIEKNILWIIIVKNTYLNTYLNIFKLIFLIKQSNNALKNHSLHILRILK